MNRIIVKGIVDKVETKTTPKGRVTDIIIVDDDPHGKTYFQVSYWDSKAETAPKKYIIGEQVQVEGRLYVKTNPNGMFSLNIKEPKLYRITPLPMEPYAPAKPDPEPDLPF